MDFSQQTKDRINLFIARSQRKIMELGVCNANFILDNNDYEDFYNNVEVMSDLRSTITHLQKVGVVWTENETNVIIDYYMSEYELDIRSLSIIEPKVKVAPSVLDSSYATKIELSSETSTRISEDEILNQKIIALQEALDNLNFDDDLTIALANYALKSELHSHDNKSVLDQITQSLVNEITKITPHIDDNIRHITQAERDYWNSKINPTDSRLTDKRDPNDHTHDIEDINGLLSQINEILDLIDNTAGADGKSPVISIGDVTEGDDSEASIDNTDPLNPKLNLTLARGKDFKPDHTDIAANRFDTAFDVDQDGDGFFTYLASDTGYLYFRNYTFSATHPDGWSDGLQFLGDAGWSPVLGLHTVSSTIEVLEITDWVGGEGDKPTFPVPPGVTNPRWYIASGGVTAFPQQAKNLKGTPGNKGDNGIFTINEVGINLAARTEFDSELFGFVFLDDQSGKIYIKESDSVADWSVGYQWRGEDGADGTGGTGSSVVIDRVDGGTSKNIKDYTGYEIIDSEDVWIVDGGNAGSLDANSDILDGGESDGIKASGTGVAGADGNDGADGDKFATSSTTSLTIGTGTKNLTIETGLAYTIGQSIIIANSSSNYMEGRVISYNDVTGALSADITSVNGSGTLATWDVNLAGASGVDGTLLKGDSVSTITAATGSKVFTLTAGLNYGFIVGHYIVAQANDVSTTLRGIITNVSSNVITVTIDDVIGTNSSSDWSFAVSGGKGDPGGKGDTGDTGDKGDSAYQVWLDAGNAGTITQYLDSLKGDDGDAGADGTTTIAQSTTSLTFATGTKTPVLTEFNSVFGDNFGFGIGQRVSIAFSATVYMTGNVTNYNIGSKTLTVEIDTLVGSGSTQSSWTITLIGEKGDTGVGTAGDDGTPAKISATATDTHSATTGSKVFNLPSGFNYGFIPNQRIIVDSASNGTILRGFVVSFSALTLTVSIDEVTTDAGSSSSWNIGIEAPKIVGADGDDGDDGFVYHGVSTSSATPTLGSKNFTLATGPNYGFAIGQLVMVRSTSNGIVLYGAVTGFASDVVTIDVQLQINPNESSSSSAWIVQLSGLPFLLEGVTTNQIASSSILIDSSILFTLQPDIKFGFLVGNEVIITHPTSPDVITNKYYGTITDVSGDDLTIRIDNEENVIAVGSTTWKISLNFEGTQKPIVNTDGSLVVTENPNDFNVRIKKRYAVTSGTFYNQADVIISSDVYQTVNGMDISVADDGDYEFKFSCVAELPPGASGRIALYSEEPTQEQEYDPIELINNSAGTVIIPIFLYNIGLSNTSGSGYRFTIKANRTAGTPNITLNKTRFVISTLL